MAQPEILPLEGLGLGITGQRNNQNQTDNKSKGETNVEKDELLAESCFAAFSGAGQPPEGSPVCAFYGTTRLFDKETLTELYPDHTAYVMAIEEATDKAVQAGFLMPEDGELIKAAAAASDIGNP